MSRSRDASPRRTQPVTSTSPSGAGGTEGNVLAPSSDAATQPRSTTTSGPPTSRLRAHTTSRPAWPSRVRLRTKTGPPAGHRHTGPLVVRVELRAEHGVEGHGLGPVVLVEALVALHLGQMAVVLPPAEPVAEHREHHGEEEGAQPARCHEPPEHPATVRDVHW